MSDVDTVNRQVRIPTHIKVTSMILKENKIHNITL
jgi:hypothetical protein